MSSRALRRLRQEQEAAAAAALETIQQEKHEESSSSSSDGDHQEDDDESENAAPKKSIFLLMDDDDESSDDDDDNHRHVAAATKSDGIASEEEEEDNDADDNVENRDCEKDGLQNGRQSEEKADKDDRLGIAGKKREEENQNEEEEAENDDDEEEEDIDAIISEFQTRDSEALDSITTTTTTEGGGGKAKGSFAPWRRLILGGTNVDPRDYDLDASLRATLGAGVGGVAEAPPRPRRNWGGGGGWTKGTTFGRPKPEWGRPPSYIGGGLGMNPVHDGGNNDDDDGDGNNGSPPPTPWPYQMPHTAAAEEASVSHDKDDEDDDDETQRDTPTRENAPNDARRQEDDSWSSCTRFFRDAVWYTFSRSETYRVAANVFHELVSSGNANALALYVADNPYFAEATLQLAMMLFHTNQRENGLELLKRALWIYDCACVSALLPTSASCTAVLLNWNEEENEGYFSALFRLMQVSSMVGCVATSLAIGRYLLSLDPLRDPMGVLLVLDYFALATMSDANAQWILNLVQSPAVRIMHRIEGSGERGEECYSCTLQEMPNWAFSVALASYRLQQRQASANEPSADEHLRRALRKFPMVLERLLEKNKVDTRGRSFQMDWPPILVHFQTACDGGWVGGDPGSNHHAFSVRNALDRVATLFVERNCKLWSSDDVVRWLHDNAAAVVAEEESKEASTITYSPAVMRYLRFDPSDYEDSFRTLPADADPLNAALVAPALALHPRRGRFLRRMPPRGAGAGGPRPGGANHNNEDFVVIDPDLPLLELFWRSMLPWVRVDGVRPAPPLPPPPPPQRRR